MKKIFILLLSALLPLTTTAADKVEIDGMWYTLDETQQTAAVAKCPNPGYIGNIVIPESVTTGGVTYAVKAIDNEAGDQGDRSLIFYFERGRDSGVKATSVFSSG